MDSNSEDPLSPVDFVFQNNVLESQKHEHDQLRNRQNKDVVTQNDDLVKLTT